MEELIIDCGTKETTRRTLTAQEETALLAGQTERHAALDAERQAETTWETKLQEEIDFIAGQLTSWPADATTNTQAIARVNFLLTATQRLARNQERVLKWIRAHEMDSA